MQQWIASWPPLPSHPFILGAGAFSQHVNRDAGGWPTSGDEMNMATLVPQPYPVRYYAGMAPQAPCRIRRRRCGCGAVGGAKTVGSPPRSSTVGQGAAQTNSSCPSWMLVGGFGGALAGLAAAGVAGSRTTGVQVLTAVVGAAVGAAIGYAMTPAK